AKVRSRTDVDGGYYFLDGVRLREPEYGESGVIYSTGPEQWTMEFYDGSYIAITRQGDSYATESWGRHDTLDAYMGRRVKAANPYSPEGNPYVTPGTPDEELDGPPDPLPAPDPQTTRPRQ